MRHFARSSPPPGKADFQTIKTFLPYLWPRDAWSLRARVLISGLLLILSKIASVLIPIFYKQAVDALSAEKAMVTLPIAILVGYGLARILAQGLNEVKEAIFAKVGQRAVRHIALETFHHLHRLSLRFHLDRKTGGLSRAIDRGIKAIEVLLRFTMFNIFPTFFEILFVCVTLWILYPPIYMLVTLLTLIIYVWYTVVITQWRTKFVRWMNTADGEANTKAIDSLLNYETVKYFNNEKHEEDRFDQSLQHYEEVAVKNKVSLSILNIGQGIIIALGLTVIMLLAGQGVVKSTMTLGDFVLVNTYLIQLYLPLNILGFAYREIKLALVDMEHMFALLDVQEEVKDVPDAKPLQVTQGALQFNHVFFAYNENRPILEDISFTVEPGQTIAIVGASGAGKSTIARLLFRFYDVTQGAILIDGQSLSHVTQESVRQAIGIVPQDTVLFNDTIYYNIAYGRPGAPREEVEIAARLAHIHSFIESLPEGYQTMVGERGLKLSGGEKQRVAIARALLKLPKIFLFDEATSALDTHTEKEIQANLSEVSREYTTVIIAHRLSTVVDAHQILVLDQGRIVEKGSHVQLLAEKGLYAKMWQRQQKDSSL